MITFELEQVEVDHCLRCGGVWLDAGELETLLGDSVQAQQLLSSFKPQPRCPEKPRKCPICLRKMRKIIVAEQAPAVLIDQCPKQHGLWFDKNELPQVLQTASFDEGQKVQKLLSGIFSKHRQIEG
jgi:hypothetical protein